MPTIRRSILALSNAEWTSFINTINTMHSTTAAAPAVLVDLQARTFIASGMSWGYPFHAGNGHGWHQLPRMAPTSSHGTTSFEKQLGVHLPCWDWVTTPTLPPDNQHARPTESTVCHSRLGFQPTSLYQADVDTVMSKTTSDTFQSTLGLSPTGLITFTHDPKFHAPRLCLPTRP
jgi:hypothetical protein